MFLNKTFAPTYSKFNTEITAIISSFASNGILFGDGQRNKIKLFELEGKTINIKSFKIPHLINKVAYKYFRKSKARRSFEYATILLENGIGTPQPIAYIENTTFLGLNDSYYISEHLDCDLTFRELVEIPEFPENEIILRQFTRFSYKLHQKGIEFLDHSPGNTLIKKGDNGVYDFFLVDLNRMAFHQTMPFEVRMRNLCRLTNKKEMVAIMSNEYALVSGESESLIFETLWNMTASFQYKFFRKKRLKKKFLFWR